MRNTIVAAVVAALLSFVAHAEAAQGPPNATVLIVRHAEKPETGTGLTAAGQARAEFYAHYFRALPLDGGTFRPGRLIATADTKKSARPRLTLVPLGQALGLPVSTRFRNEEVTALSRDLARTGKGQNILIAWHQGQIPELIAALGGDPARLLPEGNWPNSIFDWVVEMRFDATGAPIQAQSRRFTEPGF